MPVYDPDPPEQSLDLMDAILTGFTRCQDRRFLRIYGERWSTEIKVSPRRQEVLEAYEKRWKEVR